MSSLNGLIERSKLAIQAQQHTTDDTKPFLCEQCNLLSRCWEILAVQDDNAMLQKIAQDVYASADLIHERLVTEARRETTGHSQARQMPQATDLLDEAKWILKEAKRNSKRYSAPIETERYVPVGEVETSLTDLMQFCQWTALRRHWIAPTRPPAWLAL